jgi:hypothetical protein
MKIAESREYIIGYSSKFFLFFWSLVLVTGCAIRLAPNYDKTIIDSLNSANVEVMELFASTSGGVSKETFLEREGKYNKLIGVLDALRLQSSTRPVPRSLLSQVFASGPDINSKLEDIKVLEAPSTDSIKLMVNTLTKMRDVDKKQGLTSVEVSAFKGQFEISMDQALTYEKALER